MESCSSADYREKLQAELKIIGDSEMWRAGMAVRSLRPENRRDKRYGCCKARSNLNG